ncbi:2-succinyl-5-enolpyruvyl-6-hydroxy-3-cyclohexene-1-carboxylic-acid synthase [Nesterenkonia sp. NBAIMH1]|uniref:2-succinyl-5-enolpyruvyl-6-hydroxy-3- cyclohexene-1-carboxylic-acid synthase n=1 Tax=Nesterenkonia sp. NBAIMH1 TaxID=2600320 RepID=UPI0011B7735F|nr:2-succinyl-5-enolpyruvyl-6-hydroxy-3-cyclohexene-1-carboxylic-acid synthase [Nesterenkonia sp. NBAIMH1]
MTSPRRPFREFDDSHDAESIRLARRVIRGLTPGLRHVVLAPGSRSAPLAYALAEAEQLGAITIHVRIDERSAAFTALGLAMAAGEPAAVVTTSGTAAGNLTPAVMEADLAGVPLVAITADRPDELHGTGANQTTWQQEMFAGRVRDELHLEQGLIRQGQLRLEPESRDDILSAEAQVALLLRQAGARSRQEVPGPVHLNIGFADPLVPVEPPSARGPGRWARRGVIPPKERQRLYDQADQLSPAEHLRVRRNVDDAWLHEGGEASDSPSQAIPRVSAAQRTVFVLGHDAPAEAVRAARRLGQPILAEPTSGARWAELGPVQGYRLVLQAPSGTAAADLVDSVQRVVVAGRPTLSRPVQQLISRTDVRAAQYAPVAEPWFSDGLPRPVIGEIGDLADFAGGAPAGWAEAWEEAGLNVQRAVDAVLSEESGGLSSVRAAQFVAESAPGPMLLGSSSVIRDVDLGAVLTRRDRVRRVHALRGLSGIDGNVSTAAGIALAAGTRVTAVVGDLTFLHDTNALLYPTTERIPTMDVVVINDGGGAIFDQLEHGTVGRRPGKADAVERLFGTPQSVDVEALADAHHHEYRFVESLGELEDALAHPDDRLGIRIVEIASDRTLLRDLHARIRALAYPDAV